MAKVQKTEFIWIDGEKVPWDQANVHILTHSLHYGLGVFEGIRAYRTVDGNTAVFRLTDHMRRLHESARIGQMHIPWTVFDLCRATVDLLKAIRLESGYIRPIAFYGAGVMGLLPGDNAVRVAIVAWPWGTYLGEEALAAGVRVKTSSFNRLHPNINMGLAKFTGNYINSILAKREVVTMGYDEALLLDTNGYVAEGPGENLFIIRDGAIKTPPLGFALRGITRDTVMQIARREGIPCVEQHFSRDEVYLADEAFFTGTAAELTPIRELDDRPLGDGKRGPITERIQKQFFRIVRGESPEDRHWLTRVE